MIGIVQEIRAKRVLDRLTLMNEPKTQVVRSGQMLQVDSEQLVLGDLCVFQAGNQICADAVVEKGSLRVNEALITGEADEVVKNPGDILYSGSFVVSGKGYATLTKVGLSSFAAQLMLEAKASRKNTQTEMMCSLDRLVRIIGIVIIPIGNPAVFAAAFCHWFDHTGKCRIHDCITGRYDTGRTVSFSEHCTGCQCHAPWQKKSAGS